MTDTAKKPELPPRTAHNLDLLEKYWKANVVHTRLPRVCEQVETAPLDRKGLKSYGYNPAIIEDNGWLTLAYRYHPDFAVPSTKLCLSQVDTDGSVISNVPMELEGDDSLEDPKFFRLNGSMYVSFVQSTIPRLPLTSVVKYAMLGRPWFKNVVQPQIGRNDGSTMEKNWVCFEYDGKLAILYRCHPTQQIYREGVCHETPGPRWAFGEVRGGTQPVPFGDGVWLRFFHSRLNNNPGHIRHRYFVGAYLMENKPPFKVLRISRRPVIYGSEMDDLPFDGRPAHWKGNVVFPGSCVPRPNHFLLSVGVNDAGSLLCKIGEKQLHF